LATAAAQRLQAADQPFELLDLAVLDPLPPCNGHDCYGHPLVGELAGKIAAANGVLIASPVYNYDVSASCKNLIELTGSAWKDKMVGLLCAAGGQGSYMAPMGLFNSLMLDFRCLILPRFVYALEDSFSDNALIDENVSGRVKELVDQMTRLSDAWNAG